MRSKLKIAISQPEALGEPVRSRLGQAAAIGTALDGTKEIYFCSNGSPATFYVMDLVQGNVKFSYDIPGNDAVWAMAVAVNGEVYFSGTADGILYCYSPETEQVRAAAKSADDRFVWDIQASAEGAVVSATYPRSKLFEYNLHTSQFTDLGRMSEEQEYARGIAVTSHSIYTGVGSTIGLVKLDRTTGEKEELHVEGYSGQKGFIDRIWAMNDKLFLSINQSEIVVYNERERRVMDRFSSSGAIISANDESDTYYFVGEYKVCQYNGAAKRTEVVAELSQISNTTRIRHMQQLIMSEEEWLKIVGCAKAGTTSAKGSSYLPLEEKSRVLVMISCYADVWYINLDTDEIVHRKLNIPTKPLLIQSIAADEDGMLYIGGYHRGLCLYDPIDQRAAAQFPDFPQIEGIGFLNKKVYFGTYTQANIYAYDRTKPLQIKSNDRNEEANPRFVFPIQHQQDRPFTFTSGDHQLFIGTIPDYGLNTGALTIYDELQDEWAVYPDIAPNLSIVGLAYCDGLLYVGTSIWGGLGQEPIEHIAHVIIFDTVKREVIKRFVPQIPDLDVQPKMIGELTVGPDGNIWGAVYGTIFTMEPVTGQILRSRRICESSYVGKFRPVYLHWGQDGLLYTALGRKLVIVEPNSLEYEIIDDGPLSIMTLGKDGNIYYGKRSQLYRRVVTRH